MLVPRSKITVPRVPPEFVPRPALRARLARATDAPVTLVCAPAGYGKTTLLADWCATSGRADKAWVSLDADDNDPHRFWSAVFAALDDSPLCDLALPDADFLAEVIDALDRLPGPLFLILDDLHLVHGQRTLHGIETLIRYQPSGLRLVLSTRFDPELRLARLRPEGRLTELRAEALRFSTEDANRLLRTTGASRRLADGWATGLLLAARPASETADYLAREVLADLSAGSRRLLRVISVCDEVTPGLAEALSGRDDAGRELDALARHSELLLGQGTERGWYRVHPVLRRYLRADLHHRNPDLAANLHDIAAAWFAERDQPAMAVQHASRPDRLLRQHGITLLLRGKHRIVRQAMDRVGGADPVISAFTQVQEGRRVDGLERIGSGVVAELVAATCELAAGRPVTTLVDDSDPGLRAWAGSVRGRSLLLRGDPIGARDELCAALEVAQRHGFDYVTMRCLDALAVVRALAGDYVGMARAGAESIALARESGRPEHVALTTAHALLGFACLFHFDPAGAAAHAARAKPPVGQPLSCAVAVLTGAIQCDAGHHAAGLSLLRQARRTLGDTRIPPQLAATAALLEHQAATTPEVVVWAQGRIPGSAELALLAAWTARECGDTEAARKAVRHAEVLPALVPLTPVAVRLVETALAIEANERTKARRALTAALALAEPTELIRPFEYAEPAVRQLLVDQIGGFGVVEGFATRVHHAMSVRDTQRKAGPLTGQERVVLGQLTSQCSLEEIATRLSISVNTVKTHVRAIYAKLGVNNRRAAVISAREHGFL